MTCRIYNIKYKEPNSSLPAEITADINKYSADTGFGNLNSKASKAIKAITGFEAESCQIEIITKVGGFIWGKG